MQVLKPTLILLELQIILVFLVFFHYLVLDGLQNKSIYYVLNFLLKHKGKGLPQQAEVAQGVPGRLRPQIFLTFGSTREVGHQPYASSAFTLGEIPGTHF